jgi:YidC/Oxa1 family membrane protein insertase
MRTEIRFLLAVVLMIGVLVITNIAFPPVPPEVPTAPESPGDDKPGTSTDPGRLEQPSESLPSGELPMPLEMERDPLAVLTTDTLPAAPQQMEQTAELVVVESPLYRFTFSPLGGRLVSARLLRFPSFGFEGAVELVHPSGPGALGARVLVGRDTLDLRDLPFEVEPKEGLRLAEGEDAQSLIFTYRHPSHPFTYVVEYTFSPGGYVVGVSGRVSGLDAQLVFTDLGTGIPFNEPQDRDEARSAAYVVNHLRQGIRSQPLNKVTGTRVEEGPLVWAAFKSKYFVLVMLAGAGEGEQAHLGGALVTDVPGEHQAHLSLSHSVPSDGSFAFRLFMGPQEFARLANVGEDLQNVNPYGWKFFRPVVRPFVGIIMTVLVFLHENLRLGYGWVLILFGVMMRVVLYPLNQKAMKAQMKNMAAQPLLQEIQTKYKDNPEKLQKEMMKLYKEHGFNPLAGCLPMLLPWPILIALFFVFQNTIELRGVPFLWLPDLSAPDPYYILPLFLGLSMFALQWVTMRSMPQTNPQMKMMMYIMPVMMVFIFFSLASGLNLYYATANIATLPQQILIARERKRVQAQPALTLSK